MHSDTFALATRRVVRFGVIYAVLVAATGAAALAGLAAVRSGAADPADPATQASVLVVAAVTGLVGLVCTAVLLISTVVWVVSAHRLTPAGPGAVGYGGLVLCFLLIALGYVFSGRLGVAAGTALRVGAIAILVAAVLVVRTRLRRETGRPTLGGRPPLVTSDDWDATTWDPEVHRDIDRRRRSDP